MKQAEKVKGFADYLAKDSQGWAEKLGSRYDQEKRFNGDDQPVVGLTWFAATAYCHWLNALNRALRAERGESDGNFSFRLPKEQEWEWAAGGGKRKYPWGKQEPDKTRANFGQEVGHTTPVGSYPEGATPDGLMDMAGNVWEWMDNPYQKDSQMRALRGGSWDYDAHNLRCDTRDRDFPDFRYGLSGFRVVCLQS